MVTRTSEGGVRSRSILRCEGKGRKGAKLREREREWRKWMSVCEMICMERSEGRKRRVKKKRE